MTNLGNVFEADGKRLDAVVVSADTNVVYASHPSDMIHVICRLKVSIRRRFSH